MKQANASSPAFRFQPALFLLVLFAFAVPLLCGNVPTNAGAVPADYRSIMRAMIGGMDVPTFSHAVCGFLLAAAACWLLDTRRVFQLPQSKMTLSLLVFLGLIVVSAFLGKFHYLSTPAACEWVLYGVAFFAGVAILGRRRGPLQLTWWVFAAIALLARAGEIEYRNEVLWGHPDWRIFAGWTPNTQASIQCVGMFVALGLLVSLKLIPQRTSGDEAPPTAIQEVLQSSLVPIVLGFILLLGLGLMGYVLYHTGSKGGVLAFLAILLFWGIGLLLMHFRPKALPIYGRLAWVVLVLVTLAPAIIGKVPVSGAPSAVSSSAPASALGRLANAGATMDQSVGFRELLWKTSLQLIRRYPTGVGIGAFEPYSAQPGLATQTDLAHNSVLQLAVEASPLAGLLLLLFLYFWLDFVMRDFAAAPPAQNRLRLSLVAAVLVAFTHSATDSNLYTFGLGATVFLLMATAVQLSDDASTPEFGQPFGRYLSLAVVVCSSLLLLSRGWIELLQANFRDGLVTKNLAEARAADASLALFFANDMGETWRQHAVLESDPKEALADLQRAVDFSPVPKNFRALAQGEVATGDPTKAEDVLIEALGWDPNNMATLWALVKVEESVGQHADAVKTANRLIAVENGPYFSIRSIPEMVPVETYDARVFLAQSEKDSSKRIDLLARAVAGYNQYLTSTVPIAENNLKNDPDGTAGSEPPPRVAAQVMSRAADAANKLGDAYRAAGRAADAAEAAKCADAFTAAAGDLSVTK
jgi:tetratricopeptide (TPR) repeat protein